MITAGHLLRVTFEGHPKDLIDAVKYIGDSGSLSLLHSLADYSRDSQMVNQLGPILRLFPRDRVLRILTGPAVPPSTLDVFTGDHVYTLLKFHVTDMRNQQIETLEALAGYVGHLVAKESLAPNGVDFELKQHVYEPKLASLSGTAATSGLSFVVPSTSGDLQDWSRKLDNCLANPKFTLDAVLGKATMLGLVDKDGVLKYAIRICRAYGSIEARGVKNSELPRDLRQDIIKRLQALGLAKVLTRDQRFDEQILRHRDEMREARDLPW